jgi:hypothetical protein
VKYHDWKTPRSRRILGKVPKYLIDIVTTLFGILAA